MRAQSKRDLLRARNEQSASRVPSYGEAALSVLAGQGAHDEGARAKEPADAESSSAVDARERVEPDERQAARERTERAREPKRRAAEREGRGARAVFVPDYRSPTSSKTTKLRDDQHRCLKDEVPRWVAEAYPEHPNLKRLVTIEFLTQMAIDDLLADERLIPRIIERIQKACLPGG